MIKAIIFDMDGLMFDTETLSIQMWLKAAKMQNYDLPIDITYMLLGYNGKQIYNTFLEYFKDNNNVDVDRLVNDYYQNYNNYLLKYGPKKKFYIEEILNYLHRRNITLAIASSSEKEIIINNINKTNLTLYFTEIISGFEVKLSKPNPDIFLLLANRLKVKPSECLVLEDSKNGILAAKAAGMQTIMVPDLYIPDDAIKAKCNFLVKDLKEALKIIEDNYIR